MSLKCAMWKDMDSVSLKWNQVKYANVRPVTKLAGVAWATGAVQLLSRAHVTAEGEVLLHRGTRTGFATSKVWVAVEPLCTVPAVVASRVVCTLLQNFSRKILVSNQAID